MIIIKNGILLDVEKSKSEKMDISIENGKITAIKKNIKPKKDDEVIDATDKIIKMKNNYWSVSFPKHPPSLPDNQPFFTRGNEY